MSIVDKKDPYSGLTFSKGEVTAEAVVITNLKEEPDSLPDRFILVCPFTTPDWQPIMMKSAGIIVERGGILSHPAIVSREMGIPSIRIKNATSMIKSGQKVTISTKKGSNGCIVVVR